MAKKKCKLKPIKDRVIVKQAEAKKNEGRILLPEEARRQPDKGTVVAVSGDGCPVKVGDVVWFPKYAGHDLKIDLEDYKVFKHEDLLAVEE